LDAGIPDPDLAHVMAAWQGLPKQIRAAILTLISKHMLRMPFAAPTQLVDSAERTEEGTPS
jgi:hypothetical protein